MHWVHILNQTKPTTSQQLLIRYTVETGYKNIAYKNNPATVGTAWYVAGWDVNRLISSLLKDPNALFDAESSRLLHKIG